MYFLKGKFFIPGSDSNVTRFIPLRAKMHYLMEIAKSFQMYDLHRVGNTISCLTYSIIHATGVLLSLFVLTF